MMNPNYTFAFITFSIKSTVLMLSAFTTFKDVCECMKINIKGKPIPPDNLWELCWIRRYRTTVSARFDCKRTS